MFLGIAVGQVKISYLYIKDMKAKWVPKMHNRSMCGKRVHKVGSWYHPPGCETYTKMDDIFGGGGWNVESRGAHVWIMVLL